MAARDTIHYPVKNALIKDGWTITDDPLTLEHEEVRTYVDLGAERVIAAERQNKKIAVEIKSFIGRSMMRDIEMALGQHLVYLSLLEILEPDRKLYVGVSEIAYNTIFQGKGIQMLIQRNKVSLVVVDLDTEEVSQWIQN